MRAMAGPEPERALEDQQIGELWRKYRPMEGKDTTADLVIALIRKMVLELAWNVPYGSWRERESHPLRKFGIPEQEWDCDG
jgi:hypothetical protein